MLSLVKNGQLMTQSLCANLHMLEFNEHLQKTGKQTGTNARSNLKTKAGRIKTKNHNYNNL